MAEKGAAVDAVSGSKRYLLTFDIVTQEAKDCGIMVGWDTYMSHLARIKAEIKVRKEEKKIDPVVENINNFNKESPRSFLGKS